MLQESAKKPDHPALTETMWNAANFLSFTFPKFKGLEADVLKRIKIVVGDYKHIININVLNKIDNAVKWNDALNDFEKLVVLKALREEKVSNDFTGVRTLNFLRFKL